MKQKLLDYLIKTSLDLGADGAAILPVHQISIEEELAEMCVPCEGFGKTINCPPYVMKPHEFRTFLKVFSHALIFKIQVPAKILLTDERHEISKKIHQMAAEIEKTAVKIGFANSKGFASGSCKPLFCSSHEECRALRKGGSCRYPDMARPSISGLGINAFKMIQDAGWEIHKITKDSNPEDVPHGMLAGLVFQ